MMDYHIMYNDLIKKVNSLFKKNSNIRKKIYKRINYSPMQISEQKDIVVRHPCMEDIPKTIKLTYNCYAGGFTNSIHTRK